MTGKKKLRTEESEIAVFTFVFPRIFFQTFLGGKYSFVIYTAELLYWQSEFITVFREYYINRLQVHKDSQ